MPTDNVPYWRRVLSNTVDFTVALGLMVIGSQVLPDAPPPADAMNFFSGAQLFNYFATIAIGAVGFFCLSRPGFP